MGITDANEELNALFNLVLSVLIDLANVQQAIASTLSQDERLGPEFRARSGDNKNETLAKAYGRIITRIDDSVTTTGGSELLTQLRAHLEEQRQELLT